MKDLYTQLLTKHVQNTHTHTYTQHALTRKATQKTRQLLTKDILARLLTWIYQDIILLHKGETSIANLFI